MLRYSWGKTAKCNIKSVNINFSKWMFVPINLLSNFREKLKMRFVAKDS